MSALRVPPITFAHRGARTNAPENTLEAFRFALRLGASGLESDVWLTADGEPVLDHDGVVKVGTRKRLISQVFRRELPPHIPGLDDLYAECGTEYELSLDWKDPTAYDAVVAAARAAGSSATQRLWLCDFQWDRLAARRRDFPDVHLVDSTRLHRIKEGPERRAANLASSGIDAVNLHASDWTLGLTTLFHRFDRYVFGWDAQHERVLRDLVNYEIDGLYCDDVERMMGVVPGRFG